MRYLKILHCGFITAMDISAWIHLIEQNKVGLHLEMEGAKVLEVKPKGNEVDVEIHDIASLKKLRKEVKKWRG
jgi:hypothetical protein